MANVLFDFDGTLFDTFQGISRCINEALVKTGRPPLPLEVLKHFLGPPIFASLKTYAGLDGEEAEETVRLFRQEYESAGVYESRPYDGIGQLLQQLYDRGVTLGVASSKPLGSIEALLNKHDLKKYFTRVCGADKAERSDDKRKLIMGAMIERDAVMVGDRKFDMAAAKALGLRAVGVTYGFGSESELLQSGADALAADAAELKKVLYEMTGLK